MSCARTQCSASSEAPTAIPRSRVKHSTTEPLRSSVGEYFIWTSTRSFGTSGVEGLDEPGILAVSTEILVFAQQSMELEENFDQILDL